MPNENLNNSTAIPGAGSGAGPTVKVEMNPADNPGNSKPPKEEECCERHEPGKNKMHAMRCESKWVLVGLLLGAVLGSAFGYFRGHDAKGIAIAGGIGAILGAAIGIAMPARGLHKRTRKDERGFDFDEYHYAAE